jgi:GNAT superfamily N-acetyltransferase
MADRSTIVDKQGDVYTIELFEGEQYFALRVYHRGLPVGYARCQVEHGHVELAEIKINGRLEHKSVLTTLLRPLSRFRAKNYQSRGVGSKLLKELVAYSQEIGAVAIHGRLVGHKELLAKWYLRHGFEVDRETEQVLLRLAGPADVAVKDKKVTFGDQDDV